MRLYHGTDATIDTWSLDHMLSSTGNSSVGPGIYWTPDIEHASRYGKNIYTTVLSSDDITDREVISQEGFDWVDYALNNLWDKGSRFDTHVSNWGYERGRTPRQTFEDVLRREDDAVEVLLRVYCEFFHGEEREWCEVLSDRGIFALNHIKPDEASRIVTILYPEILHRRGTYLLDPDEAQRLIQESKTTTND